MLIFTMKRKIILINNNNYDVDDDKIINNKWTVKTITYQRQQQ